MLQDGEFLLLLRTNVTYLVPYELRSSLSWVTDTYVSVDNDSSKTCVKWLKSALLFWKNKGKNGLSSPQWNMLGQSESAGVSANWIAIALN